MLCLEALRERIVLAEEGCRSTKVAASWADDCLAQFRERWAGPEETSE